MKDAERIAELEAALRRSELLVEQLQAQLNLGRKKVQAAPAGEREVVPRELLERLEHVTRNLAPHLKCHADLTAILTEQPQASAGSCVCGEPESPGIHRNDAPCYANLPQAKPCTKPDCFPFCDCGGVDDAPQASAAQSAPAGFDFTIEDRGVCRVLAWSGDNGCRPATDAECAMGDAIAAWQRAQSAPVVPDVSAMARVLSDRSADACGVNRDDNWNLYSDWYIEDVRAMLAAPAQPAAQGMVRAALSPENQRIVPVEPLIADPHPLAASPDQGEVQRLREALEEVRSVIDARETPSELDLAALSNMIDAALAANTDTQEARGHEQ